MAGTLVIDTLKASTGPLAVQNGMSGIVKAWVNFTGDTSGTIRTSFNVSSVTYNSTANYTINFATALPNANYAYALGFGTNDLTSADVWGARCGWSGQTTTSHNIRTLYSGVSGSAYGTPPVTCYIACAA